VLYNPSLKSVNFMIPSIIGLIMSFQTILLTAFAVTREREQGTLEQIIVTPIRTWEFMLGKILPYTVTSSVGAFGAVLGARLMFNFRIAGDLGLLILLSLLFLMGSLGLGLLVSVVSKTQGQATQTAMFIMIPSILLSGFIFSRDAMPWIVRQLGLLVPLTYYVQIVRGVMLKGVGIAYLWPAVWPLLIYSIVVFGLSALLFQKRTI
jgi:ABC-2 type transport system permease protein